MPDTTNIYGYDDAEWQAKLDAALFEGRARREAKRLLSEEESPSHPIPEIVSLAERMTRPRVETSYRIEGWQPAGSKIVLVAQAKAGKSSLSHNLARVLVDGSKWLETAKVTAIEGRVTILDFEMPENMAEDWLNRQGATNASKINLCGMRGSGSSFNILDPRCREQWAHVLATAETSYLILDCLRPILDAIGLDEHRDAGKFFGAYEALLKDAGITETCVIHHMGHGGERSRGDSRIIDWPDAYWTMTREDINDQASPRFLRAYGRDVEVSEQKLLMDDETKRMKVVKGGRTDVKVLDALEAVVSVLKECKEPTNQKGILLALKDTEYTKRDIIKALHTGTWRGVIEAVKGQHNSILYSIEDSWVRTKLGGGEE